MDEVDGRPGHVALQFGFLEDAEDAPQDAPKLSLCFARGQGSGVRDQDASEMPSSSIFQMTFDEAQPLKLSFSRFEESFSSRSGAPQRSAITRRTL
jgi:hypothetical protein